LYVGVLEQKYTDIGAQMVVVFLTITLAGVLVASALSYYISRRISGAIRQLVTASEAITHGNLDARADVRSRDELRELADTFNAMASALQKRDEQLRQFTVRKIMESERLALIGQLAANVAHELNNPLQGIVTYSRLLLERMPAEDASRPLIQKIVSQADRSRSIIRGLLDFSRHRMPNRQPSDVNQVLRECVALVEDQASFHNIEWIKNLSDGLPPVTIDPAQIQQVFINLMINAAEAMGNGGRLTLSTRFDRAAGTVQVEFADTGHGITADNMERIFDPFFTTKETGHAVGLGLAISYGVIKEHQGTITVQSEVGKGTTFAVQLPVAQGAESGEQDSHH